MNYFCVVINAQINERVAERLKGRSFISLANNNLKIYLYTNKQTVVLFIYFSVRFFFFFCERSKLEAFAC